MSERISLQEPSLRSPISFGSATQAKVVARAGRDEGDRFMSRSTSARSSSCHSRKSRSTLRRAYGAVASFEALETRRMLSVVNWVNKGTGAGAGDTDDFNAIFGADATIARVIVQRAVDDWERVITDFKGFAGRNTFDLTVSADAMAAGTAANTGSIVYDPMTKPESATVTLDDDGGGVNWYFDTLIGTATNPDDSDFTTFLTPWAADNTSETGRDLYRTTINAIGHAMGFSSTAARLTSLETAAGDDPNSANPADVLKTIDIDFNGVADYTLTTNGGRHLFEGGGAYAGPVHPDEVMNSGRSVPTTDVRRQLISDTVATLLSDVFDYTITLPSRINTFYVNLNRATNSVTVTGDMNDNGNNADVIDLELDGTAMSFEVNGMDETIEGAEFNAITVNAGAGADDVDVDQVLSGKTVVVNGEGGTDFIDIAAQFGDVDGDVLSDVTADGGAGADTLTFNDFNGPFGPDPYTITAPAVATGSRTITHDLFETVRLTGSNLSSTYNIDATAATYALAVVAGTGGDTFVVGGDDYDSNVRGAVDLDGGAGLTTDALVINDLNDSGADVYTLTHDSFAKSSGGGALTFSQINGVMTLNASDAGTRINLDIRAAGLTTGINGNGGDDTLDVGGAGNDIDASVRSPFVFNGGPGNDVLELDDSGDAADADDYTILLNAFIKSSPTFAQLNFVAVERINLVANDGANDINAGVSLPDMAVSVNGGGGDDYITDPYGDLNAYWLGDMVLTGGAGFDRLYLDDGSDANATNYTLTASTFTVAPNVAGALVTYGEFEHLTLDSSDQGTTINVDSTAAGTLYDLVGNLGDDAYVIGGAAHDARGILGEVFASGSAGTDRLSYHDDGHAEAGTYTIANAGLSRTGTAIVHPSSIESMQFHASDGADTITVNSTTAGIPTTVNGHLGDDTVHVGAGLWDGGVAGNVTVNGGGGSDALFIDDSLDAGADGYNVTATQTTTTGANAGTIDYATVENLSLNANQGANAITVNGTFDGDVSVAGGTGADDFDVIDHFAGRVVTVDGGAGLDQVRVNGGGTGAAAVQFANSQDFAALEILTGGTASMAPHGSNVLVTQALSMTSGTTLDLTDNGMILDYTGASPLSGIIAILIGAHDGGTWTGPGITSSTAAANPNLNTAVGYAEATDLFTAFPANVNGVAVDSTALLLKYTFYGDANLNGNVNLGDFNRLAANFGQSPRRWSHGNFDFNANVNLADFNKLAAHFGSSGLAPDAAPAAPASPGARGGMGTATEELPSLEELMS
jgi:hypothetical protein